MHVAVLGAGALGCVYGARLALRAGARVTFIVRAGREKATRPFVLSRVDGDRAREALETPALSASVPADADVVLVTVRAEQLDDALDQVLQANAAPIVMLTPLLPSDHARLAAKYGARLRVGMAGVVAYFNDEGVCRYWLPRLATTLIEEARPESKAIADLALGLKAAGIDAKTAPAVQDENLATTVAIVPLAMGLDAAGSIDDLLADKALFKEASRAVQEGLALSRKVGKTAGWLGMLAPFTGPRMLRIGAGLARKSSPEACLYVERHFGRKLHAQNVSMGRALLELAEQRGVDVPATRALLEKLVQRR